SGVAEIWKRKAGYPQKLSSSVNIIHSQLATVQCDGHPYFESELGQMELEAEFDYLNFLLA
ncbi:MAG TPA: hypothetical protein VFH95_03605, partial [Candidatus Kapabacteria bacterium]|nr:hypothetical protein [Candidatus Kapabacteria bacterium]